MRLRLPRCRLTDVGTVVIPKSVTASRIEENFQDFVLEKADFEAINELSKNKHQRLISPKWGVDVFEESA